MPHISSSVDITKKEIFDYAKRVYFNKIRASEAAQQLHLTRNVNINSAKICFKVYQQLINGFEFKRALSAPDMDYFLSNIFDENGAEQLQKSVKALWLHIVYYENKNKVKLNSLRDIAKRYDLISNSIQTIDSITQEFWDSVNESLKSTQRARLERLKAANSKPDVTTVNVQIFKRNPDVVAEVLCRANGKCELCECDAPFRRKKDHSPYLEVHHKVSLSNGGSDSVKNAVALCPNCHRKVHFGI